MKPRLALMFLLLAMTVPAVFLLAACADDPGGTEPDPTGAAAKVRQANAALEQILYDELNEPDDPERPSDVDFSEPHRLYSEALALDSGNRDAHFGVAVTGLLILSADTEVNAAFDEWKEYLDSHTPFEVDSSPRAPLGIPIRFESGSDAMRLPYDLVLASAFAQAPVGRLQVHPQIERVQAIIEDRVLPKALLAVTHLGQVSSDPGYTFTVTPRMQGDEDEDPAEIDRTDILTLRAGCSLLAAACHIAVSYELGFAAYDSLHLHQALQQGSGWLALRTGGAVQMAAARTAILNSIADLDSGITSLLGETDSQHDDVIKIDSDDLARADVESVRVHLPDVRDALTGGHTRADDWDDDPATPDLPLTIDLGSLFSAPVPDWKALLPPYAVSLRRRALESDWHWSDADTTAIVSVAAAGYYGSYYRIDVHDGERYDDFWGDEMFRGIVEACLEWRLEQVQNLPQWTGDFSGSASVEERWLEQGEGQVEAHVWWDYETATEEVFIPVITWDASSFEEWTLPDPTFHGLLPEIGTTSELWNVFGVDGDGWEKELELDWTDDSDSVPPWPGSARLSR
jgi:hypothetical protein